MKQFNGIRNKKIGNSSISVIVSGPDFVGAIEDDSHVFFFFRELALESSNCGKVRMRLNQPEIMTSFLTFGSVNDRECIQIFSLKSCPLFE